MINDQEVSGARQILDSTEHLIDLAKNDGITDSRKLQNSIQLHGQLERELLDWQVYLSSAHRDWEAAYHGAVKIEAGATEVKGAIANEIQLASSAAHGLQQAARAISELKNWMDRYPVSVDREAGDSLFHSARQSLADGDYRGASASALAAINSVGIALSSARSSARRARADEETARRRSATATTAVARSRRATTSAISRSSSSMSGRSSSSRSRSSGSGFSRSGW